MSHSARRIALLLLVISKWSFLFFRFVCLFLQEHYLLVIPERWSERDNAKVRVVLVVVEDVLLLYDSHRVL